jgi:hypothetical protein
MDPKLLTDLISEEQAIHFFYSIVAAGFVFRVSHHLILLNYPVRLQNC